MSSTAADRAAAHRRAVEDAKRFERLTSLHRRGWPAAAVPRAPDRGAPAAPAPPRAPGPASPAAYAQPMLRTIPRWYLGERRVAHEIAARQAAEADRRAGVAHERAVAAHERRVAAHRAELERLAHERAGEQRLLERAHERLATGERAASARAISEALRDLPTPAQLCGWHGPAAVVAVRAPGIEAVPEREPAHTAGGKPSVRKLNQGERNDLHAEVMASITIAAARRALAAAPGVASAVAAAHDARGAILAYCRVARDSRPEEDPISALYALDGDLAQVGRTRTVAALDVADVPPLQRVQAALSA